MSIVEKQSQTIKRLLDDIVRVTAERDEAIAVIERIKAEIKRIKK